MIWVDGGARNPRVPTLFQVADVDTGVINWVNARSGAATKKSLCIRPNDTGVDASSIKDL